MALEIGAAKYDETNRELTGPNKKKEKLPPGIHDLLMCLMATPDVMVKKEVLLKVVSGDENQLWVYVSRLKGYFEKVGAPQDIENMYGEGYVLSLPK